jgi:hypothetical protein
MDKEMKKLNDYEVERIAMDTVIFCQVKLGIRWTDTNKKNGNPEVDKRKWEDVVYSTMRTLPKENRGHFIDEVYNYYQK